MKPIDHLVSLDGVLAAGEFVPHSDSYRYAGLLEPAQARMAAVMCRANSEAVHMQADLIDSYATGIALPPPRGWIVSADHFSVCVLGTLFCFLENATGSLNQVMRAMFEVSADHPACTTVTAVGSAANSASRPSGEIDVNEVDLHELLQLPGAIAAFGYSENGDLDNYRILAESDMTEAMLDMVAHMCAANRCIASMQARGWERATGAQGFYPVKGFGLIGCDWSVISHGRLGVVVAADMADYEACIHAMDAAQPVVEEEP